MEKILKKRLVFKGRVIRVEEKEIDFGNGKKSIWESAYMEPKQGVSVLAIDKNKNVYLVKQFKGGTETRMIHLATGGLLGGVNPKKQAQTELREETGYRANKLTFLMKVCSNPGYTDAWGYIFLGEDLVYDPLPQPESEETKLIKLPLKKAIKMIGKQITDQRTIVSLLYLYCHLHQPH